MVNEVIPISINIHFKEDENILLNIFFEIVVDLPVPDEEELSDSSGQDNN